MMLTGGVKWKSETQRETIPWLVEKGMAILSLRDWKDFDVRERLRRWSIMGCTEGGGCLSLPRVEGSAGVGKVRSTQVGSSLLHEGSL